jgi:hypothetical protein
VKRRVLRVAGHPHGSGYFRGIRANICPSGLGIAWIRQPELYRMLDKAAADLQFTESLIPEVSAAEYWEIYK